MPAGTAARSSRRETSSSLTLNNQPDLSSTPFVDSAMLVEFDIESLVPSLSFLIPYLYNLVQAESEFVGPPLSACIPRRSPSFIRPQPRAQP